MTEFEFVQVTVAIILGLGLTDILRNLGEQIRKKNEIEISALQVMASCLLLLVILVYSWTLWRSFQLDWTLPLFVLQVVPAIALALSAQVLKVDCESSKKPEAQYFGSCAAAYAFWAMAPLFSVVFSFVSNTVSFADAGRFGVAILLLSVAFIKKSIYHKVVLSTLLLVAVIFPAFVQFDL